VPSVARKPPVADVRDLPVGCRFDCNDEIHATASTLSFAPRQKTT
jgi:hypothetical protein